MKTKMMKTKCLVFNKMVANLNRHMRLLHEVIIQYHLPANDLRTFALILSRFPLILEDWVILLSNKEKLANFISKGDALPPELIKILSYSHQGYLQNRDKLIILAQSSDDNNQSITDEVGCFQPIAIQQKIEETVKKNAK